MFKKISEEEYVTKAILIYENSFPSEQAIKEATGGNETIDTVWRAFKKFIQNPLHISFIQRVFNSRLFSDISNGYLEKAESRIRMGANINAKDQNGYTPLHRAVDEGNAAIIQSWSVFNFIH